MRRDTSKSKAPFQVAYPPAIPAILAEPCSIPQFTSLPLMQKLHRFGQRTIEQLFAFSSEYGIIITKQITWCDSEAEIKTINQDLSEFGYLPRLRPM